MEHVVHLPLVQAVLKAIIMIALQLYVDLVHLVHTLQAEQRLRARVSFDVVFSSLIHFFRMCFAMCHMHFI